MSPSLPNSNFSLPTDGAFPEHVNAPAILPTRRNRSSSAAIPRSAPRDETGSAPTTATVATASSPIVKSSRDDTELGPRIGGVSASLQQHRRRRSSMGQNLGRKRATSLRTASPNYHPVSGPPHMKISEEWEDLPLEPILAKPGAGAGAKPDTDDDFSDLSDADLHDDEETGLTSTERSKRREARQRNARLDQRIARGGAINLDENRDAQKTIAQKLVIDGGLVLLWYIFSLSISLYNKWMFDNGKLNFPFPLFTTALHMVVQFSLSCLVLHFFPRFRPNSGLANSHEHGHASDRGRSRHESEPPDKSRMTVWYYWTRIAPCGAATGLDIGLGNASLKFITLTFYTMCKSSSLAFVLAFAFLLKLEPPTWRLVAIIGVMTMGVLMMVAGEVEFNLTGFVLVISAALFSGFRWGLTQILLLRNPTTSNPFSSIFYLAPIMCLTLCILAVPTEGFSSLSAGFSKLMVDHGTLVAPLLLLFPGIVAFAMTASEFALLQRTSVVTLSIAGIFKEVVTISAAAVIYHDTLTLINISGLVITLCAIIAYNVMKWKKLRRESQEQRQRQQAGVSMDMLSRDRRADIGLVTGTRAENTRGSGGLTEVGGRSSEDEERVGLLMHDADDENGAVLASKTGVVGVRGSTLATAGQIARTAAAMPIEAAPLPS